MQVNGMSKISSQPIRTSNKNNSINIKELNNAKDTVNFGNVAKVVKNIKDENTFNFFLAVCGFKIKPMLMRDFKDNIICRFKDNTQVDIDSLLSQKDAPGMDEYIVDKSDYTMDAKADTIQRYYRFIDDPTGKNLLGIQTEEGELYVINLDNVHDGIFAGDDIFNNISYHNEWVDEGNFVCVDNIANDKEVVKIACPGNQIKEQKIYKYDDKDSIKEPSGEIRSLKAGEITVYTGDAQKQNGKLSIISPSTLSKTIYKIEDGNKTEKWVLSYSKVENIGFEDTDLGLPDKGTYIGYDNSGNIKHSSNFSFDDKGRILAKGAEINFFIDTKISHNENTPFSTKLYNLADEIGTDFVRGVDSVTGKIGEKLEAFCDFALRPFVEFINDASFKIGTSVEKFLDKFFSGNEKK